MTIKRSAVLPLCIAGFIGAALPVHAENYKVVNTFRGKQGGVEYGCVPLSGLINVAGTLYGTTSSDAETDPGGDAGGASTIYSITLPSEQTTILYSFTGLGSQPTGDLLALGDTLYGINYPDNAGSGNGTVFSYTPSTGIEHNLFSFNGTNGRDPAGGLIKVTSYLYGTTVFGGAGSGTVFRVGLTGGNFKLMHSFTGSDGALPEAALVNVGGTLYGTAEYGGTGSETGTIFSMNPATGALKTLYKFSNGADGANPTAPLLNVNGILYGTASDAGYSMYCAQLKTHCGALFSINPASGQFQVLYTFQGGSDGGLPTGGLTYYTQGVLYGTTSTGGTAGYGTLFSYNIATGQKTIVHNFLGGADGAGPSTRLLYVSGTLWGTTPGGGRTGCGTVFLYYP